jgi:hypothetical protein
MRAKNKLFKLAILPVLAVALAVAACSEDASESGLTAPKQAAFSRGGESNYRTATSFVAAPMSVTAEVGREGALLRADQYFLLIPRNAVREKTTFKMEVGTNGLVSLLATRTRADGTKQDVGVLGFREKLTLALYYGNLTETANVPALQVGWVLDNGSVVTVPSLVNTQYQVVYGQLSHFSKYSLVFPDTGEEYP